jgi:glycosyltransferase involved in cell wall biosynthesis
MDEQRIRLSIVVACRNEARDIREFMDSLLRQQLEGISWEAIIADGASTDGTREILEEYSVPHPRVRILSNPQRIVSTGLNAAIRAANGEIVIRMDAHTLYAPDYCRVCIETLERTGADNVGGPARTRATGRRARAVAAAFHSKFSTGGAYFHDDNYEGPADTVTYGCWRRSTFDEIGFFDEALVRNQDDELNLRLVRSGGRIWQNPAIKSWYSPRGDAAGVFRQYFQYGFWKVAVIRKHRRPASLRHLVPLSFVLANAFLLVGAVVSRVAGRAELAGMFAVLWLWLLASYAAVVMTVSVLTARENGWDILGHLPMVFAAYHLSYGLGFLAGLRWLISPPATTRASEAVPAVSK